jgi:peptidoglycan hydrolase-like protein with peptidoglycan-binding domain
VLYWGTSSEGDEDRALYIEKGFAMKNAMLCRFLLGVLCLVWWPVAATAYGDWRIGQAQERLKALGFTPGPIDGVLGPRTKAALRRYQAQHGLPATAVLDEATRTSLLPRELSPGAGAGEQPRELPQGAGAGEQRPPMKAPPGGAFRKVSTLVQLPDFLPGLGTLYVDPRTLPVGPFLAYDRQGNLVSSVYMLPLKDLGAHRSFSDLPVTPAAVNHVDIYYNEGHPGVPDPHYHLVLWYIPPEATAALK